MIRDHHEAARAHGWRSSHGKTEFPPRPHDDPFFDVNVLAADATDSPFGEQGLHRSMLRHLDCGARIRDGHGAQCLQVGERVCDVRSDREARTAREDGQPVPSGGSVVTREISDVAEGVRQNAAPYTVERVPPPRAIVFVNEVNVAPHDDVAQHGRLGIATKEPSQAVLVQRANLIVGGDVRVRSEHPRTHAQERVEK
jgi:hypothetical protein